MEELSEKDLTDDQFRAYDIIALHLEETLAGKHPSPLRMIVRGEGGGGRRRLIETVTNAFIHKAADFTLVKSAHTGIAASLIDGKTMHFLGTPIRADGTVSDEAQRKVQQLWRRTDYLIIDEYAMITKTFLAQLSRNVGISKHGDDRHGSFGGMNVVLCGSRDQFKHPPAGTAARELLEPADGSQDEIHDLGPSEAQGDARTR